MSQRKSLALVFLAAVLMSTGGLFVKLIPWQSLSINSFRCILSVMVLLIFAKVTHHKLVVTPCFFLGGIAVCGATVLYTMANKLTTAGNAILIQYTYPMFVILFAWLILRDRPKRRDIIACIFIFSGVTFFFVDGLSSGGMLGNILALISGICYACVFLLNRLPGGDALWSSILGQAIGIVIGFPFLLQETQFDLTSVGCGVALGVFQVGLAYAALTTGLRYAKPVSASLVAGIEPVLNPILVAIVVGETLTPMALLGGAVVLISVLAYNVVTARAEEAPAKAD